MAFLFMTGVVNGQCPEPPTIIWSSPDMTSIDSQTLSVIKEVDGAQASYTWPSPSFQDGPDCTWSLTFDKFGANSCTNPHSLAWPPTDYASFNSPNFLLDSAIDSSLIGVETMKVCFSASQPANSQNINSVHLFTLIVNIVEQWPPNVDSSISTAPWSGGCNLTSDPRTCLGQVTFGSTATFTLPSLVYQISESETSYPPHCILTEAPCFGGTLLQDLNSLTSLVVDRTDTNDLFSGPHLFCAKCEATNPTTGQIETPPYFSLQVDVTGIIDCTTSLIEVKNLATSLDGQVLPYRLFVDGPSMTVSTYSTFQYSVDSIVQTWGFCGDITATASVDGAYSSNVEVTNVVVSETQLAFDVGQLTALVDVAPVILTVVMKSKQGTTIIDTISQSFTIDMYCDLVSLVASNAATTLQNAAIVIPLSQLPKTVDTQSPFTISIAGAQRQWDLCGTYTIDLTVEATYAADVLISNVNMNSNVLSFDVDQSTQISAIVIVDATVRSIAHDGLTQLAELQFQFTIEFRCDQLAIVVNDSGNSIQGSLTQVSVYQDPNPFPISSFSPYHYTLAGVQVPLNYCGSFDLHIEVTDVQHVGHIVGVNNINTDSLLSFDLDMVTYMSGLVNMQAVMSLTSHDGVTVLVTQSYPFQVNYFCADVLIDILDSATTISGAVRPTRLFLDTTISSFSTFKYSILGIDGGFGVCGNYQVSFNVDSAYTSNISLDNAIVGSTTFTFDITYISGIVAQVPITATVIMKDINDVNILDTQVYTFTLDLICSDVSIAAIDSVTSLENQLIIMYFSENPLTISTYSPFTVNIGSINRVWSLCGSYQETMTVESAYASVVSILNVVHTSSSLSFDIQTMEDFAETTMVTLTIESIDFDGLTQVSTQDFTFKIQFRCDNTVIVINDASATIQNSINTVVLFLDPNPFSIDIYSPYHVTSSGTQVPLGYCGQLILQVGVAPAFSGMVNGINMLNSDLILTFDLDQVVNFVGVVQMTADLILKSNDGASILATLSEPFQTEYKCENIELFPIDLPTSIESATINLRLFIDTPSITISNFSAFSYKIDGIEREWGLCGNIEAEIIVDPAFSGVVAVSNIDVQETSFSFDVLTSLEIVDIVPLTAVVKMMTFDGLTEIAQAQYPFFIDYTCSDISIVPADSSTEILDSHTQLRLFIDTPTKSITTFSPYEYQILGVSRLYGLCGDFDVQFIVNPTYSSVVELLNGELTQSTFSFDVNLINPFVGTFDAAVVVSLYSTDGLILHDQQSYSFTIEFICEGMQIELLDASKSLENSYSIVSLYWENPLKVIDDFSPFTYSINGAIREWELCGTSSILIEPDPGFSGIVAQNIVHSETLFSFELNLLVEQRIIFDFTATVTFILSDGITIVQQKTYPFQVEYVCDYAELVYDNTKSSFMTPLNLYLDLDLKAHGLCFDVHSYILPRICEPDVFKSSYQFLLNYVSSDNGNLIAKPAFFIESDTHMVIFYSRRRCMRAIDRVTYSLFFQSNDPLYQNAFNTPTTTIDLSCVASPAQSASTVNNQKANCEDYAPVLCKRTEFLPFSVITELGTYYRPVVYGIELNKNAKRKCYTNLLPLDTMQYDTQIKNFCGPYLVTAYDNSTSQDIPGVEFVYDFFAPDYFTICITQSSRELIGTEKILTIKKQLMLYPDPGSPLVAQENLVIKYVEINNDPPIFEPDIIRKHKIQLPYPTLGGMASWSYKFPSIYEDENDPVTVRVVYSQDIKLWFHFNEIENKLFITNLYDPLIPKEGGEFPVFVYLWDGKNFEIEYKLEIQLRPPGEADSQESADSGNENKEVKVFDWKTAFLKLQKQREKTSQDVIDTTPQVLLENISNNGRILFKFTQPMFVIEDLQSIKNGTFKDEQGITRKLVEIQVSPGSETEVDDLKFDWSIVKMDELEFEIAIHFQNPMVISQNAEPETVHINFNNKYMFFTKDFQLVNPHSYVQRSQKRKLVSRQRLLQEEQDTQSDSVFLSYEYELPVQFVPGSIEDKITQSLESAQASTNILFYLNLVLNFVLSASLNHLWSLVNTQQLIVLMCLYDLQLPANVDSFFSNLMGIAAFDVIDIGDYLDDILDLEQTEPLTKKLASLGFDSRYFINNLGTLSLAPIFYAIQCLIYLVATQLKYRFIYCAKKKQKLKEQLFYSQLIILFYESFIIFCLCAVIYIPEQMSFESIGLSVHTIYALISVVFMLIWPIVLFTKLCCKFEQLQKKQSKFKDKFGEAVSDLNLNEGRKVLGWPMFFLFRRFLLVYSITMIPHILVFQVICMYLQLIAAVIGISYLRPHQTRFLRRMELFNEVIIKTPRENNRTNCDVQLAFCFLELINQKFEITLHHFVELIVFHQVLSEQQISHYQIYNFQNSNLNNLELFKSISDTHLRFWE